VSYWSRESSVYGGQPFELYLFETETETWRLTSADREITHDGAEYSREALSRTNTTQNAEVKGGHITVTLPAAHPVAQLFVAFIPQTPLSLVIYRGHEGETDDTVVTHFTGRVLSGRFTTADTCELDCAPDTDLLRRPLASTCFQRPCNRMLFDDGCTLASAAWAVTGTVLAIGDDQVTITIAEAATQPDGWFATGTLEKGVEGRMVTAHVGTSLTLLNPMNGLAVGDAVTLYAGCDRTYSGANGCDTKFSNGPNFMGWEWIPGQNPFSGGVG
jgi:uncharacterized phage protein (TIGR02218 family)